MDLGRTWIGLEGIEESMKGADSKECRGIGVDSQKLAMERQKLLVGELGCREGWPISRVIFW